MRKLKTIAVAAVAAAAGFAITPLTGVLAQVHDESHAAPHGHTAPTEAEMQELQRQMTALFSLVYQHADFEAVDAHLTGLIADNAAVIGGDTEAFATHVSAFLDQVAAQATADPQHAAEFTATMLIEAHRPHGGQAGEE
jgi:hypothetical protein